MSDIPYRQIHMDFHTSGRIPGVGSAFEARTFGRTLRDARVASINLFAKCHHGFHYYPSRVGPMHPGLGFDLLGEQIRVCREEGIRPIVYTCTGFNEHQADLHPEWLQVSATGVRGHKSPFESGYFTWRFLCLANPAHRAYLRAELTEIHERYAPPGYWVDIVVQDKCCCDVCVARMLAAGLDPRVRSSQRRNDRIVEVEFALEMRDHVRALNPEARVYFNGHAYEMDLADDDRTTAVRKREACDWLDVESLPSDACGYTHFPIAANYLNHTDLPLASMNGKFHLAWGDFGTLRNLEALEYECFRAIANGARCSVGDQLHPTGRIDPVVYARIGEVFRSIETKEPWLRDTRKVAQIGVFAATRVLEADVMHPPASIEGVYRILSETHHLFDFIDFTTPLERYDLLILPDVVRLPPAVAARIRAYLADGGAVLATAWSGLEEGADRFALPELAVSWVSEAVYAPRYVRIGEREFPGLPPMDHVLYEGGVTVRAEIGGTVAAFVTNPYFNRTFEHFSSHRQTPPAEVTTEPCVVDTPRTTYVAHPLFKDYAVSGYKAYKLLATRCIDRLLPARRVTAVLPTTAEVTLRRQGNDLVLHILNYVIQRKSRMLDTIEEKPTLFDREVSIRCGRAPRSVELVPEGSPLPFRHDDGVTHFVVPRVDGHRMVRIQGAET